MMLFKRFLQFSIFVFLGSLAAEQVFAAIALDRTRVIFDGGSKSISLGIANNDKELPYLAQGWVDDEKGNKKNLPLVAVPPVQRVEPGEKGQIKVQALPAAASLPQDRESLFYFNVREIPPKSEKKNVLQIALQTRVKLFYRPDAIRVKAGGQTKPWQEEMRLLREGDAYRIDNPTPYFIVVAGASDGKGAGSTKDFEPLMIPPKSSMLMKGSAKALGEQPVLVYVNDFGGRPSIMFKCTANECLFDKEVSKNASS